MKPGHGGQIHELEEGKVRLLSRREAKIIICRIYWQFEISQISRGSKNPLVQEKYKFRACCIKVNLCQKLLFLHQLTHNMTTESQIVHWITSSIHENFKLKPWENLLCTEIVSDIQYTTCFPHVLQKEKLLTKIYL